MISAVRNCVTEIAFTSSRAYGDPFNDVRLDVLFTDPEGRELLVPAFWAGENVWKARYSSPLPGRHRYRWRMGTREGLSRVPIPNGREGEIEVVPYEGENPLFKHGPVRVSENRRTLEHLDGTPFFWLGDTWWFGFTSRLGWPGEFHTLVSDRVVKGFSVIQIVAGLYPDIPEFDPRGANRAGVSWEEGYGRPNPGFFDMVDLKVDAMVRAGLVPCIVGSWGFYIKFAGVEVMKRHWRNLIGRYGAYPVVWCAAGEAVMPFYGEDWGKSYPREARAGWTEVARYIRSTDPFGRPLTVHPTHPDSREMVDDESVLDIDMLQTGHRLLDMEPTVRTVRSCVAKTPRMPVVSGEVMYEGIMGTCWQDIQRFCFWTSLLSGTAGHTYGANGLWQFSTPEEPCTPISGSWGEMCWKEACRLPGSGQVGLGRRLLERYPWWEFVPREEPEWDEEERIAPFAAGAPGKVWVMYLSNNSIETKYRGYMGKTIGLEPGARYRAYFFDPRNGRDIELGPVKPDPAGRWRVTSKPSREDWVLVLEAVK